MAAGAIEPSIALPSDAALAAREVDVALQDGSPVHVRPVRPVDLPALRAFLTGLSLEDRRLRWFTGAANLDAAARWAAAVDRRQRDGVLAIAGDGTILGHAAWARLAPDRAEIAFEVAGPMRGRGLATVLLAHLAFGARAQGIATLVADVLPENHRMLEVFRNSGLPLDVRSEPGVLVVEMPATFTPEARAAFEQRDRIAAIAAMDAVLRPRSIAVVGASPDATSIGGAVFANLLAGGYTGALHAVNRRGRPIDGHPCHRSVEDVPGELDAVVLAIPARETIAVAQRCATRGVRALVVLSAGFAETGAEGVALQHELLATCRAGGIRLVGPNCLGVLNTDPDMKLDASFAPSAPPAGGVGLLSQSGGVGIALLEQARTLGIGISAFVSVGNKADLSGNDFLDWCEQDERTHAILLYLESFGNPHKFSRIARRVGRAKPIVAVKAGRTPAGARAASSHTGVLLAGSEVAVEALFRQAGVLRVDTLGELFDLAVLLDRQSLPVGPRVAIVTNAGGPGIMCADACQAAGLELPELSQALQRELAERAPSAASLSNPVDLIAAATPEAFGSSIEAIGRSGAVDAIVAVFVPPLVTHAEDVARAIGEAARALGGRLPLLTVFMTAEGAPAELRDAEVPLPSFRFPEDAARALGRAAAHARWRAAPGGEVPAFADARPDEAAAIIAHALQAGATWLDPGDVHALLACHGLPLASQRIARTPTAAARAAAELGGPVVLKAIAPGLLHKSDAGGVALDLAGPTAVRRAAQAMRARLADAGHPPSGFLVQRMAPAGVEMLVGATTDPLFGPVLVCGAGGRAVELLRDIAVRLAPLTDRDAREMLRELSTFPLLEGYRGEPPVDIAALEDVLLRISTLVEAHPEVVELDCNPVIASTAGAGAVVVDARIRVAPCAAPVPTPALRT
ncbi:MAG TPA: GNAT family N-acetyltransferase [Conexibacter sp.]|jgi:acetyl coenzyme A synthetase (ADP forming)-like protein|nr:GNAT family N-acetyltransferase [Conexibacter sp.]